ncbi:hypothetical protein [Pseudorhizobium pelagicum]|uniref:Uncharacterized protein n=1 Tax=Pseudorhizobium pelagicum TaxID=1509405 RepID=A0A922P0K6_9HYPH|nr:hypothetical protein [Pseudorhizobium pelagicum]KEQ08056.1 hypothetical protein GV67_17865 [Pseudorhizobium pelagicum]KEQ10253.1 hypothetical protein GV68_15135 [Pseudorhizobium pelagicum]
MAIIIPERPKLTRRDELEFEIAGIIEEAAKSVDAVSPVSLAGSILDLIEIETGMSLDGPPVSAG